MPKSRLGEHEALRLHKLRCNHSACMYCRFPHGYLLKLISVSSHLYLGTSWLQTIVWCIMNHNQNISEISGKHIYDLVPLIELTPPGDQPQLVVMEEMPNPRVLNTHLPPRAFALHENVTGKKTKFVYGIRNPKDVLVSFYHHCRLVSDGAGDVKQF